MNAQDAAAGANEPGNMPANDPTPMPAQEHGTPATSTADAGTTPTIPQRPKTSLTHKIFGTLVGRIIVAIILGSAFSFIMPVPIARIFVTFNGLFSQFLSFFVPLLIVALVTPAIARLGRGAGRWLAITTGIAYISTLISGLIALGTATALYPILLRGATLFEADDVDEGALQAFFTIKVDPPLAVMTALVMAFSVGVAMTSVRAYKLQEVLDDFERVVMRIIHSFLIPLLPVFIFGLFLQMGMNGNLRSTLVNFSKVLVLAIAMTWVVLALQYIIAGSIARVNPWRAFTTMLPAYFTALGTSSSAATIPVSLECAKRNKVDPTVAGFTIPLCATIHLAGSMMKISLFAFAIVNMAGIDASTGKLIGFLFMLGITMVAAPGVPGGAIMAATGLLTSMLGFTDPEVAIMIAAYIAIDSFGTAANVAGDGAIALVMNRMVAAHPVDQKIDGVRAAD